MIDQQQTNNTETTEAPEVLTNKIMEWVDDYCVSHNVEDMAKEPPSRWNACLIWINREYIKPNSRLLKDKPFKIDNNNTFKTVNNNQYNLDVVNVLVDMYIYSCYEVNKIPSKQGFSYLSGITLENILNWGNRGLRASESAFLIAKKLEQAQQDGYVGKLSEKGVNPVGSIAVLNHLFNWDSRQPQPTERKQSSDIIEIQQRYSGLLADSQTTPEDDDLS